MSLINFIMGNYVQILSAILVLLVALVAFLHAAIAFFMFIPGPQPEAALQTVVDFFQKGVDFVKKFSAK